MGVTAALDSAQFNQPEGLHGRRHDLVARKQAVGDFHAVVAFRTHFDGGAEVGRAVHGINKVALRRAQQGSLL